MRCSARTGAWCSAVVRHAMSGSGAPSRTTSAPAFGETAARLERARVVLRERLGPAAYTAAGGLGRTLTDDEAVALARDAIARTAAPSPVLAVDATVTGETRRPQGSSADAFAPR